MSLNTETDWEPVRRAMRNAVEETSLRELARKLGGVSPSGLQKFLDGATPKRNASGYLTWFHENGARFGAEDEVLESAVELVLRHVPRERRVEARTYLEGATGYASKRHRT